MPSNENIFAEYISGLATDRVEPFTQLHNVIIKNIPKGFAVCSGFGGVAYSVPHSLYPAYHCKPTEPLPFAAIVSQKNSINLYHMGLYAVPELYQWFVAQYPKIQNKNWIWEKVVFG